MQEEFEKSRYKIATSDEKHYAAMREIGNGPVDVLSNERVDGRCTRQVNKW